MSIINRALNRVGYLSTAEVDQRLKEMEAEIKAAVTNPPAWLRATAEHEAIQDVVNMTMPKAQISLNDRLSWVNTAVRHVGGQCSGVPFQVLTQQPNEENKKIDNHEFELLMQKPNPTESRFEVINTTASNYKLTGNGFWWMNKASEFAKPDEVWTIPTHMMRPLPDGNMFIKGYAYNPGDGVEELLLPWEVVHFKQYNAVSRYWGLSEILSLALISVGDLAMQKHNTEFFTGKAAKISGLLAYADPVPDPEWERLQAEMKTNSEKRNLMMLRNVGKGGVEWIKMGMSQAEMEFIQGRNMNKEEIWSLMAPGLASWLAINTTEANAKVGRDAFKELAVWPILQVIQEKITNEILSLYGENLIGKFDDVRPVDKAIKLQEQAAAEKVITIDEYRKTFLNLDTLEDKELGGQIVALASASSQEPEMNEDDFSEEDAEPTREEEEERTKFRRFVKRRGSGEGFVFHYLNEVQQEALKAKMESNDSKRLDLLIKAVDMAKESVSV